MPNVTERCKYTNMPAGRPTKYDPMYCDMLVEHMVDGASIASFAAEIDVSRSTINQWAADYPEFSEALSRARAKSAAWWEENARKLVRDGGSSAQSTMIIFGLKNMSGDDWREKQEIDHRSGDGSMTPKEPRYVLVDPDASAGE